MIRHIALLLVALTAGCSFFRPTEGVVRDGGDDEIDASVDAGVDSCTSQTWYRDSDGDGFGVASESTDACAPPDGYVADGSDCDDLDDAVHPDAEEVCNGRDDNCDETTDEGCEAPVDDDGDGYCRAPDEDTNGVEACTDGGGDCDDTRADIHPGAPEQCGGLDYDCDDTIATAAYEPVVGLGPVRPAGELESFARLDDRFAVAWAEKTTTGRQLRAVVLDAYGTLEAGPITLSDERGWIDYVSVEADPVTGTFVIVYVSYDSTENGSAVRVARISDAAVVELQPTRVDEALTYLFGGTSVATASSGDGTIGVFYEKDDEGNRAFYYVPFDTTNDEVGPSTLVSTEVSSSSLSAVYDPSYPNDSGSFALMWSSFDSNQTPARGYGFLRVLRDGRVSGLVRRHRTSQDVFDPALFALNDVLWMTWAGDYSSGARPVYVTEIRRSDGAPIGANTIGTDGRYNANAMLGYDEANDVYGAVYASSMSVSQGPATRWKRFDGSWNETDGGLIDELEFSQQVQNAAVEFVGTQFVALDDSADAGYFNWWRFPEGGIPASAQSVTGQSSASLLESPSLRAWAVPSQDVIRTAQPETDVWEIVDIAADGSLAAQADVPPSDGCPVLVGHEDVLYCWGFGEAQGAVCDDPDAPDEVDAFVRRYDGDTGQWEEVASTTLPGQYSTTGCPSPSVIGVGIHEDGVVWVYQRRRSTDFSDLETGIRMVSSDGTTAELLGGDEIERVQAIPGDAATLVRWVETVPPPEPDLPATEKIFARLARPDGTMTDPVEIGEREEYLGGPPLPSFFNGEYFVLAYDEPGADTIRVRWVDTDGVLGPAKLDLERPLVELVGDGRPGYNVLLYNRLGLLEHVSFNDRGEVLSTVSTGYYNPQAFFMPPDVFVGSDDVRFLSSDYQARIVYGRGICVD